ncbi:MAG: efflux RND transporter periplasmic adaptor subunit [bacterium]|nr:efflux RND transporter periplasmic adaptor subunit [bacterium]
MQSKEEFDKELQKVLNDELPAKGGKKKKKKWKKKPLLISAVGLIGLAVLILRAFGGSQETAVPVSPQPLSKGSVVESITLSGPVSGTDSVDVVSNLHLEVLDIVVNEGDSVEKGQLLATLDSSSLEREIEMAQNTYDLAVAARAENQRARQAAYEKAVQSYDEAKKASTRANILHEAGDISDVEWETAKHAMTAAQKDVDSYEVSGGRVKESAVDSQQVENARFELKNKQRDLENTQITSPISGTVVRVNSKVGRFADKTEDEKPMFIIENLDRLQISIRVSEYSIGKVKLGQKAVISADILNGKTVEGVVSRISPTGEEKGDGSTERVIPITISVDSNDSGLIAGITAKAKVTLAEANDTFVVPISSLVQDTDGNVSIAVVRDGKIHLLAVTTGVESDFETEIFAAGEEALTEGMLYLPNPPAAVAEGMPVTVPQTAEAGTAEETAVAETAAAQTTAADAKAAATETSDASQAAE